MYSTIEMDYINELKVETLPETYPGRVSAEAIVEDIRQSLNPENIPITGCELHHLWIGYAEHTVEPVGWQALWRATSKTNHVLEEKLCSPALVEAWDTFCSLIDCLAYSTIIF